MCVCACSCVRACVRVCVVAYWCVLYAFMCPCIPCVCVHVCLCVPFCACLSVRTKREKYTCLNTSSLIDFTDAISLQLSSHCYKSVRLQRKRPRLLLLHRYEELYPPQVWRHYVWMDGPTVGFYFAVQNEQTVDWLTVHIWVALLERVSADFAVVTLLLLLLLLLSLLLL